MRRRRSGEQRRVNWEERYAETEYFFGKEPSMLARMAARCWNTCRGEFSGKVLDLGCGEGRDAVYFASLGFQVTAVDLAPSGLEKARRLAEDLGAPVPDLRCQDIRETRLDEGYDLFFAGNSLGSLGRGCVAFIRRMQRATPKGGLHAVRVATTDAWGLEQRPGHYRFDRLELKHLYRGWQLLYYAEDLLYVPHMDRLASFADIIARKTRGR